MFSTGVKDIAQNIVIRNLLAEDIPRIIKLQKESFPYMAAVGAVWKPEHLEAHIKIFPQGQFCAAYGDEVVGSCSSLITRLEPEYKEHTWYEVCGGGFFKNHMPSGDSLYAADVSVHPKFRRLKIATKLYKARRQLAIILNLKRIIAGGRLFNYCDYAKYLTPQDYVQKVIDGKIQEPVLSFQLANGFKFIKILPNYLNDPRSLNYATFIEWKNPHYVAKN